jgi:hypothetical protein
MPSRCAVVHVLAVRTECVMDRRQSDSLAGPLMYSSNSGCFQTIGRIHALSIYQAFRTEMFLSWNLVAIKPLLKIYCSSDRCRTAVQILRASAGLLSRFWELVQDCCSDFDD